MDDDGGGAAGGTGGTSAETADAVGSTSRMSIITKYKIYIKIKNRARSRFSSGRIRGRRGYFPRANIEHQTTIKIIAVREKYRTNPIDIHNTTTKQNPASNPWITIMCYGYNRRSISAISVRPHQLVAMS